MEAWLNAFGASTALVAFAEIGDKTQLLAFALSARYRRHGPIVLGILVATLVNHAIAGSVGVELARLAGERTTTLIAGLAFLAFGAWALVPDRPDAPPKSHGGVFLTTLIAFFIAEMGDKTQLATVALGARFGLPVPVVVGTTLGMMIANVPAVLIGARLAHRLPLKAMRIVAALLFFVTGVATLVWA